MSEIRRSFLLGRCPAEAIGAEIAETSHNLCTHGLFFATFALQRSATPAFNDYIRIRSDLYSGGHHCVRLTGGRSIDRAGR
jgi:hypothetical protein